MSDHIAEEPFDVIVGGGGLVGQTLALGLDQAGARVAVVDAAPPAAALASNFDGRAFAIAYANFRMWRALGIADDLKADAQEIKEILVTDGRPLTGASPLHLHFDFAELNSDEPLGYMVENRHLRVALHRAIGAHGRIRLVAPAQVQSFARTPASVSVQLANGASLRASLLVGADGRNSFVRKSVGIKTIGRDYPTTAIVATVAHERAHGGVAHEYFLPTGPFAILPLAGNRANVVWGEPHAVAAALLAMPEEDFVAELRLRFGDFLGRITLEGPKFSYPLSMRVAERMIDHRVALAGDSAHAIHPIAGQGLNLGLKDVAALCECVADALALGLDAGDLTVLERYQRWRRFDNVAMAGAMDFFDRLFSNDIAPLRRARGLGLAIVNGIGPARRFFMRFAGGESGTMPKLLRGEKLAA
jgi:2-octaprenyl-6-methoxyphenol hydroxylase